MKEFQDCSVHDCVHDYCRKRNACARSDNWSRWVLEFFNATEKNWKQFPDIDFWKNKILFVNRTFRLKAETEKDSGRIPLSAERLFPLAVLG